MFTSPLIVELKPKKGRVLHAPLVYQGARDRFKVAAGFSTDLASVPRLLWWLIPPLGLYQRAAVIHDYLYREQPCVWMPLDETSSGHFPISRKDADGIFYRIMKEEGVWTPKAWIMWKAVSWFGWISWKNNKT